MNDFITSIKMKCAAIAYNVSNSKAYRAAEKVAIGAGASLAAIGVSAVNASAIDWGNTITAETAIGYIADNASGFVEPAIIILCAVSGLRLGMKFLRGSAK